MTYRTAYVCAIFFGPRRSWLEHWGDVDPLYCLREHVKAVVSHSTLIERVIFVCNLRDDDLDAETYAQAQEIIERENEADSSREWIICSRPNYAFSYGAWEHGLVEHTSDLDFAFLIEDDYIPVKQGFDKEMVERYFTSEHNREWVIYCSSLWKFNLSANSNGIINLSAFRMRNTFSLPRPRLSQHIYKHGDACQRMFLRKFTDKGFEIIDMSTDYVFPFFCMAKLEDIEAGGPFPGEGGGDFITEGEVMLRPISYEGGIQNDK